MKKMLSITVALTAAVISMSTANVAAIAAIPDDENFYALEDSYDINNENYRRKVDSLGKRIAYEEEFVAYLNSEKEQSPFIEDIEDCAFTHVYNVSDCQADGIFRSYIVESIVPGTNKKARKFEQILYYWGGSDSDKEAYVFANYDEVFAKYSVNEMNVFLEEVNLKAKIVTTVRNKLNIVHYDDTSEENVVATFLALNKKFGAELVGYSPDMEHFDVFYDNSILGDANKDGEVNVRDCAFIASKLAEGLADELPEYSDYNGDGKVNVRDAAALAKNLA